MSIQRSVNENNSKQLNNIYNAKPPREVALRVKFIRLGEVIYKNFFFLYLSFSKGNNITRKILC